MTSQAVGLRNTRRVWLALSNGVRGEHALVATTGLARRTVFTALRRLEDIGYITREKGIYGALVVVVPFRFIKKPAAGALSTARESTPAGR